MEKAAKILELISNYCNSNNENKDLSKLLLECNYIYPELDFKYSYKYNKVSFKQKLLNENDYGIISNSIFILNNFIKDNYEYSKKIKLNKLFSNLPGAVFKCLNDKKYTMIYLSDRIESISGYKKEELLKGDNYNYSDLILSDDRAFVWETIQDSIKNNNTYEIEYRIKTKSGDIKWLWEKGEVFSYDKQEYIEGFILDVSSNRKLQHGLSVSEQRYQDLVNNSLEGIFIVQDKKIVYANSACFEISGYSKKDLDKVVFYDLIYKDDAEMVVKNNIKRKNKNSIKPYDFRIIKKSGEIMWLHINATKIKWKNEDAVLCFVTDINERKTYEIKLEKVNQELIYLNNKLNKTNDELISMNKKLQIAKQKAEESDKLKSVFLSNMSHEIRTPMNGIIGFISLINENRVSKDKQKQLLRIIENSSYRMLNLLNDLLEISQIESGISKAIKKQTIIYELLVADYEFYSKMINSNEVKLEYIELDFHKTDKLFVDEIKIQQVLSNLIRNSIKFTEKGFIKYGCTKSENGDYIFFVKDSGLGINIDKHKIIFNRFAQANLNPVKPEEGTGLGLSIAKAFVEMHNGTIWLESEKGKGSTFYFKIPKQIN